MPSQGTPLGTIFFKEHVITVPETPRGVGAAFKLPVILSPRTPRSFSGSASPTRRSPLPRCPEDNVLPSLTKVASPVAQMPMLPTTESESPSSRLRKQQRKNGYSRSPRPQVSDRTLSELNQVMDSTQGAAVCRYDCINDELARDKASKFKMAYHRREVVRHECALQRKRVRKRDEIQRQQAQIEEERKAMEEQKRLEEVDAKSCVVQEHQQPRLERRRKSFEEVVKRLKIVEDDEILEASGQAIPQEQEEDPLQTAMRSLHRVKLNLCKESRMMLVNRARVNRQMTLRSEHLADLRNKDFEQLPAKEQDAFKKTWALYSDASICAKRFAKVIDGAGRLFQCLAELGLDGKDEAEQKEIKAICNRAELYYEQMDFHTFCFDFVPEARAKLMEMHQEALSQQFAYYDCDGNGFLEYNECLDMVNALTKTLNREARAEVEQECLSVFNELKKCGDDASPHVDFDGFQMLIARLREKCVCVKRDHTLRIMRAHKDMKKEQEQLFADELLMLHETFTDHDVDKNGKLDMDEVIAALSEHGLMPYDVQQRKHVKWLVGVAMESAGNGGLSLSEFLTLIRHVRVQGRGMEKERLNEYFQQCDKDGNGRVSFAEACSMFHKLGLSLQCRQEQQEVKNWLIEVDKDKSGDLDFDEFQVLTQQIMEKIRSTTRHHEDGVAAKLGFTSQQVTELREIFFQLDVEGLGTLGIAQCRKVLTLLRIEMTAEALHELFQKIVKDKKSESIVFEGFLYFVRDIGKHGQWTSLAPKEKLEETKADLVNEWNNSKKVAMSCPKISAGSMLLKK